MTFSSGSILTAAQLNTHLRDNLLETAPAKATAANQHFVGTGAGAIAARLIDDDIVETSQTTTSTSYANLATTGPEVTSTTGTLALVTCTCELSNSTSAQTSNATFAISGATTTAADDIRRIKNEGTNALRMSVQTLIGVTAGVNVFTMKYRVSANTGTFLARRIHVMPF